MPVSEHDHAYMERIGALKAASHAEAVVEHHARSVAERLRRSWLLFLTFRERASADDEVPTLYARARALGLYEP